MPRNKRSAAAGESVSDYRHEDAKRKNNPPAGLAVHGRVPGAPKLRYAYDPHLPPVLRFDSTGRSEYLDELIERAIGGTLSEEDGALLRELLGKGEPWLEWGGKREAHEFVVDPVALHIHERVSTAVHPGRAPARRRPARPLRRPAAGATRRPRRLPHRLARQDGRGRLDDGRERRAGRELVDQPEVERNVGRVAGPFSMEAVMPVEQSEMVGPGFAGEPEGDLETFDKGDVANAEAFVDKMLRLLAADGVRFPDNRTLSFNRLDRIDAGLALHAEDEWANGEGDGRRVVVSIGPEHGPVTAYQVEEALREDHRRGADDVVFAGFSFDGAAQAAIQEDRHPRVRAHLAHIAPDVQMGELLKATPNSQLFSVFGLPRAELRPAGGDEWIIEMQRVDIYDPVRNTIHATRADKVAAWLLDTDCDGRTFCITQAFFPDRAAWKKLERALRGTIDAERFDALTGTMSLPFKAGKHRRVAVKVIDPRGNEVMRVMRVGS